MPSARERLDELVAGMRRRQEQESQAEGLWKKALPRCTALARSLVQVLEGQGVRVGIADGDGQLVLAFPGRGEGGEGARCLFKFNRRSRTLEGWRTPFTAGHEKADPEHFFSLTVALPATARPANEFGPQSVVDVPVAVDTQEAFERAVVDFLEWAMVRDGCGGEAVRLP
jgi:hypothetical protein